MRLRLFYCGRQLACLPQRPGWTHPGAGAPGRGQVFNTVPALQENGRQSCQCGCADRLGVVRHPKGRFLPPGSDLPGPGLCPAANFAGRLAYLTDLVKIYHCILSVPGWPVFSLNRRTREIACRIGRKMILRSNLAQCAMWLAVHCVHSQMPGLFAACSTNSSWLTAAGWTKKPIPDK